MEKVIHGANIGHVITKRAPKPPKTIKPEPKVFGANVGYVYQKPNILSLPVVEGIFCDPDPVVEKPTPVVEKQIVVEPIVENPKLEGGWKAKRKKRVE